MRGLGVVPGVLVSEGVVPGVLVSEGVSGCAWGAGE